MQKNVLLSIAFIEGACLMGVELLSSKILATFYGNSLIIWTTVFICTMSSIALGYFFGGKLAKSETNKNLLFKILLISSLLALLFPFISKFIMQITLSLPIEIGSIISVLVFLFPILFCFGMVSPLIIHILTDSKNESGKNSGIVYSISTFGGILSTIITGYYFIPILGVKMSNIILFLFLVLASAMCYKFILSSNKKLIHEKKH